ncbi:hypothetical protein G210_1420 [Candida maltosa Xu316]|uniref:Uncharacterized protein n=1 Tax=Candida maltosa (strain Xu316) TaxID=1245528 RepID=M3INU0_CANMX|nr:hypothetical protein G210_1420 [Candida maltosa Xu316]
MFNQCIGCDLKRSDDEPIFDRLNVLCPICRISRYLNQFILTNIQHQQQHHQEVSLLTDEEIYDSIDYNLVAQFMKKKFSESTKIYALKQLSTSHKSMNHIKVLLLKDEYLKKFKFGSMTDRVIVQQCNKFIKHINQFGVLSFDEEESEDDVAEILPRVESSSSSPEVQEIPPTEKTEQQPKLSSVRKRSIEDDKDANNSTKKPNNDKILESTDKNQNTNPALPMDPQKTQQEILSIPITNQSVSINMTTPKTQMTSSNLVQQSNTVANKNLATQNPPSQSKPPSSSKTLTCIKCNTDWNAEYGFSFNLTSLCPQCYLINNLLGFGENLPHLERLKHDLLVMNVNQND